MTGSKEGNHEDQGSREARGPSLMDALEGLNEDFIQALERARAEPLPVQERELLSCDDEDGL